MRKRILEGKIGFKMGLMEGSDDAEDGKDADEKYWSE
jgi:hypothetical protein